MAHHYTVSGDSEHVYVSGSTGRIVATCADMADAKVVAAGLNGLSLLEEAVPYLRGGVGSTEIIDLRERIQTLLTGWPH